MIPNDKLLHAIVGAFVALIVYAGTGSGALAFVAALAVGIGKELWDRAHPADHTEDRWDAIATALPAGVLWLVVSLAPEVGVERFIA